jgi:Spy/CpxP family protein refolding chaperone
MKGSLAVRVGFAIGAVLMTGAAMAQAPMGGPGMGDRRPPIERAFGGHGVEGRWWNNPKIVEQLKLTDDQRKAFDQILLEHREKLIDLRGNVEKAELQMEPLVQAEQPNESAILAQIDKVAQARAELEKANARYLLALRSKLTLEQWKQVQEFRHGAGREGWERDRRGRDGMRPGGRGGPGPDGGQPAPGPQGTLDDQGGPPAPGAAPAPASGPASGPASAPTSAPGDQQ